MYDDSTARRNGSGYADPTAGRAIARADAEAEAMTRLKELRQIIWAMARHDGVYADVVLTDKRTGVRLG